jgi:predicted nucleic acid-binding protein
MSTPTAEQLIDEQKKLEIEKKRALFREVHDTFVCLDWNAANNELLLISESIAGAIDKMIKAQKLSDVSAEISGDTDEEKSRSQHILEILKELPVEEASAFLSVMQNALQVSVNLQAKGKTVKELDVKLL